MQVQTYSKTVNMQNRILKPAANVAFKARKMGTSLHKHFNVKE